jgi:hypothetical protein
VLHIAEHLPNAYRGVRGVAVYDKVVAKQQDWRD